METCKEITKRYDINFVEIGSDGDHIHFLIQLLPTIAPSEAVIILKSITAREIFKLCLEVKAKRWGGNLWSAGYFVSTVGKHANEKKLKTT